MDAAQQVQSMQQAVQRSNMLKLSKCRTKLKRRIPFTKANVDVRSMDQCTIYVESFPKEVTSEHMVSIFKRAGTIRYIKLPRFPDENLKGFCFIEYSSNAEALKAVQLFNNCVPEEFVNTANPNYIARAKDTQVTSLRVMPKSEWQEYKSTVQQIKREVSSLAFGTKQPALQKSQ